MCMSRLLSTVQPTNHQMTAITFSVGQSHCASLSMLCYALLCVGFHFGGAPFSIRECCGVFRSATEPRTSQTKKDVSKGRTNPTKRPTKKKKKKVEMIKSKSYFKKIHNHVWISFPERNNSLPFRIKGTRIMIEKKKGFQIPEERET